MLLVVGLGNPGPKYEAHRHNIGFRVADELAQRRIAGGLREKFKGLFGRGASGSHEIGVLKPLTYMNLAGESVQPAMQFFKIALDHVLVVHDELDLPFGTLRVKVGGGTAGHNGLKSIIQHCGGPDFVRLRFGIGRPQSQQPRDWVLSDFSASERAELPDLVVRAADICEFAAAEGAVKTMNRFN